jgi:hypothetical protein
MGVLSSAKVEQHQPSLQQRRNISSNNDTAALQDNATNGGPTSHAWVGSSCAQE